MPSKQGPVLVLPSDMRNLIFKSVFLVSALFAFQPAFSAAPPMDAKEVQELKNFGSLENKKGNLLTPARGAISPGAKAARELVTKIIQNIAGKDLADKKINLVVNVYANNSINAWVWQMDPTVEKSAEAKWNKENPNQLWPLRKDWGFEGNKDSIYEIGVTTALLRKLQSQDELAFILGHELTHLFEGHTDNAEDFKDRASDWWSSQAHEAVADHNGVDRILGKYELEAALSVMDKLHPKSDKKASPQDAFDAIESTHHAEGVRISALQFYIEYLRRYDSKATIRTEMPLPNEVKLNVNGRAAPETIEEGSQEDRIKFIKVVRAMMKGKFDNASLLSPETDYGSRRDKNFLNLFGDERYSYRSLLIDTLNEVEGSDLSKTDKVNVFLKAMIFLGSRSSSYKMSPTGEWFKYFSETELRRLMSFLVVNASGEHAWNKAAFTQLFNGLDVEALEFMRAPFFGNKKGQEVIQRLGKLSASWQDFLNYQTSMQAFERGQEFRTGELAQFLYFLDPSGSLPKTDFLENVRAKILKELHDYPYSERLVQALDKEGLPEFTSIYSIKDQKSPWRNARNKAAEPHAHLLKDILYRGVIKGLIEVSTKTPPPPSEGKLRKVDVRSFAYLSALTNLDLAQLSASEMNQLLKAFQGYIEFALIPNKESFGGDIIYNNHYDVCAALMAQGNRELQLKILKFIFLFNRAPYTTLDEMSENAQSTIRKAIESLSSEEKFALIEQLDPIEVDIRKRTDYFSKKYKVDSFDQLMDRPRKTQEGKDEFMEVLSWHEVPVISKNLIGNMLFIFNLFGIPQQTTLPEFKRYLRNFELAERYAQFSMMGHRKEPANLGTAALLFKMFTDNVSSTKSFEEAANLYMKTMKIIGAGFSAPVADQQAVQNLFKQRLSTLPLKTQAHWLEREVLRKLVGAQFTGETLATYLQSQVGSDRTRARKEADRLEKIIPLKDAWPDSYKYFRESLSEKMNLQPHEVDNVFAKSDLSITEKADVGRNFVRGMSGFSSYTRAMPYPEQIEMIEFMMGRSNKMPKTLAEQKVLIGKVDIRQSMLEMREEIKYRSVLDRSMIVNSILAGENAMIQTPEGLKMVHDHLLKSVAPQNQEIAMTILNSLAIAEGRNKSLLLSYALAQLPDNEKPNEGLTEALVLRSLLDAYGVPGVKLAQYLAFTSEFKDFNSALEIYQDAAMPISYYDALLLLQKRLGASWDPSLHKVNKIIGSGSVNIAIEYQNLKNNKAEVISIARDQIEIKTKEDFRRFQLLIKELNSTPERKEKFEFVTGLLDLIQRSVTLEFDKQNSFKMQKSVQNLYRQKVDGWNLQTIDAYEVMNMGIRMEKAPGSGARKILKKDPKTYESAMRAFMKVEYAALRGVNEKHNWIPISLHANPDVHDGQIMIDVPNKTVTILDFGQALQISNQERELALDILRIISGVESPRSAEKLIQKHAMLLQKKSVSLDKVELAEILKRGDRMDVFVHFLSLLNRSGFEAPLSSVHWVLAANRIIKLGEKINIPAESSFKWMIGMRKVGLPLIAYNAGKAAADKARDFAQVFKAPQAPIFCQRVLIAR